MKTFLTICFVALTAVAFSQTSPQAGKKDPAQKTQIVDVACGTCQFHLKGKECALAIKMGGKAYFVDGADIDAFGDAHAKNGFCNKVSKAEVQGKLVNGRFKATYVKLITDKKA